MGAIFITGIDGIIGSVLRERLAREHLVTGLDRPRDLRVPKTLDGRLGGIETVIHLARERDPVGPGAPRARINPANVRIDLNVFSAVVQQQVARLVLASSVHADDFRDVDAATPLHVPGSYCPATPYGTYKLIGEEVGSALAAQHRFEFVAVRFGGVTRDDSVKEGKGRTATWLSHRDLGEAVAACVARDPVPGRATVFYAVSNNADRVHDTRNPFGWEPRDDATMRMR